MAPLITQPLARIRADSIRASHWLLHVNEASSLFLRTVRQALNSRLGFQQSCHIYVLYHTGRQFFASDPELLVLFFKTHSHPDRSCYTGVWAGCGSIEMGTEKEDSSSHGVRFRWSIRREFALMVWAEMGRSQMICSVRVRLLKQQIHTLKWNRPVDTVRNGLGVVVHQMECLQKEEKG